jgi:hypothetical protein
MKGYTYRFGTPCKRTTKARGRLITMDTPEKIKKTFSLL